MKMLRTGLVLVLLAVGPFSGEAFGSVPSSVPQPDASPAAEESQQVTPQSDSGPEAQAYRAVRGSRGAARSRTPVTGTTGRTRSPTSPDTNTGTGNAAKTNPTRTVTPAPAARAGSGWGRFFGGLALGSMLGGLFFHPFGFGWGSYGGGFSLGGLVFWGILAYIVYRLFRRIRGTGGTRE